MIAPAPQPIVADISNVDISHANISHAASSNWRRYLAAVAAWSVFAGFHALALVFFGIYALGYWVLPDTGTSLYFAVYRIGMAAQHYRVIAVAFGSVAAIHCWMLLQMIVLSIQHRQPVFSRPASDKQAKHGQSVACSIRRGPLLVYHALFSSTGLLGINGPCYDLLLLLREVVETALQTVQAYRMSQHLARAWLNQFYVGLLVANCWFMAIVHTAFHHSPMTRYFVTLLCDLMLDFATSVGVPSALAVLYAEDVNIRVTNVFGLKWYEDVWQINAVNEFQLILVVSWADLASRLVFALSMVSTLNTLKRLSSIATDTTVTHRWRHQWGSVVPETSGYSTSDGSKSENRALRALVRANEAVKNSSLTNAQRIAFAVWGCVVLALHVHAQMAREVPQCVMQVRPWGITLPSCNLVLINCYQDGIDGRTVEVNDDLQALYPPSMTKLVVRHCPSFEMPPAIRSFPSLVSLKIYNTSIVKWDQDAALTKSSHPFFSIIMLIRVRFVNGLIPLGLQADDFPPTLSIFGFLDTNVRSIPDDLDSKWASRSIIHFDTAQLTEVPDVLLRLVPKALELAGNPIRSVPQALFQLVGNDYIGLGYTGISALPENVTTPSNTLKSFNLDGTNVSSIPMWVDEWLAFPGDTSYTERISASGSPYCAERDRIFSGEQAAFTMSTSSKLMNASTANWGYLKQGVACTPTPMYRYPLWMEDLFNALP